MSGVQDDDVLDLLDFQGFFALLKYPCPESKNEILSKLEEDGIIVRRSSRFDITNLGALLIARDMRKFEHISRKALRIIFYRDNGRLNVKNEFTINKGYAVGFNETLDYLNKTLPINEDFERALRTSTPEYPPKAVREFLANALMHQDLTIRGTSPMIEVFESRLEITNPGRPLIDTQRFLDHSPVSRNEKMASLMRRMEICEEKGIGIDRAISQCELYQLPAPDFQTGDMYTKVVMFAPMSLRQMNKEDKIRACYQHCCLQFISGERMNNESFRNRLNIQSKNYPVASRIIKETINVGLIKSDGNGTGKFMRYVPYWV